MGLGTTNGHPAGNGNGTGASDATVGVDYTPIWRLVPGTRPISVTLHRPHLSAAEVPTTLQARRDLGIDIPALCYEPKLAPYGACRSCAVEVEGSDDTPSSCGTTITEGMVITTHSERVIENRRMVLELIFSDH